MIPGHADRKPSSHRMPDQVGALGTEIVDHGNDVAGSLLLTIELWIGPLIALPMAQRIDAGDAKLVAQRIDNAGLLPVPAFISRPCCNTTSGPAPSTV
jgi:hypothetical protein